MLPTLMRSLFADYLTHRRPVPNNGLKPSRSILFPHYWAGGIMQHAMVTSPYQLPIACKALPFWKAYVEADELLREYILSDIAFTPPNRWPTDFPFEAWITPRRVAEDFLPQIDTRSNKAYGSKAYQNDLFYIEGLHELVAYCHSWPVTADEINLAREAAWKLLDVPSYLAYAYIDISAVPMRTDSNLSYIDRSRNYHVLCTDPLAINVTRYKATMPEWAQNPKQILDLCPPRKQCAPSSHKHSLIHNSQGKKYGLDV